MRKAFTLIELVIAIVIIVILWAVMVPLFSATRQSAKLSKVNTEFEGLAHAIERFRQDTGYYPCGGATSTLITLVENYLQNNPGIHGWNGPYMVITDQTWYRPDPWGTPYSYQTLVNSTDIISINGVNYIKSKPSCSKCISLLSAGPDMTFETADDIRRYPR